MWLTSEETPTPSLETLQKECIPPHYVFLRTPLIHSHFKVTFVTVVNLTHADTTFLTWYEATNLILKLPHSTVGHPAFLTPVLNTIVRTWAPQLCSSICVYFIRRWS